MAADELYARHFLAPHFDQVGTGCVFTNPWHIKVMGPAIELGDHVHIIANAEHKVRLAVWPDTPGQGRIRIGDYSVINPGLRLNSAYSIDIGKNAIFAAGTYITDCDWHGHYDRVYSTGGRAAVTLKDNVWVGESVIIGKGVTIGCNSIIGAGSVVVKDIPDNVIAAGNPARVVKELDPQQRFVSRDIVFAEPERYFGQLARAEQELLADNSLRGWFRYLLFPSRHD